MKHGCKIFESAPKKISWGSLPHGTICWFNENICIVTAYHDRKLLIGISDPGFHTSDFLVEPIPVGTKIEITV